MVIGVQTKGLDETLKRLEGAERGMPTAIERSVARSSLLLARETRLQLSGKGQSDVFLGRKGATAPFLGARSGGTRSRITPGGQVFRSGDTFFSAVGSPDKYMPMQEEGGTITGNKFLRIPLASAQTGGGTERGEFKGRSLRDVPGIFLVRSHGGRLFAARSRGRGRGARVEFLYLLTRSVRIPARHPFQAVRERVAPEVNRMTGGEVETVMRKANNG